MPAVLEGRLLAEARVAFVKRTKAGYWDFHPADNQGMREPGRHHTWEVSGAARRRWIEPASSNSLCRSRGQISLWFGSLVLPQLGNRFRSSAEDANVSA